MSLASRKTSVMRPSPPPSIPISFIKLSIIGACTRYLRAEFDDLVGDVAIGAAAARSVDMKDFDALDLLHRADAFAHDALDPFQQLAAETRQPRGFRKRVLRFVQLLRALRVHFVAGRGRRRLDLLGFRLTFSGYLGGFGETRGRGLFRLGLSCQPHGFALGLSRGADEIGDLSPLGDLPFTRGDGLLLRRYRLPSRSLRGCYGRGPLGGLVRNFDGALDLGDLDGVVPRDLELAQFGVAGDARLREPTLRRDARPLDFFPRGYFRLFESLALGDVEGVEQALALQSDLVESSLLRDPCRLDVLVGGDFRAPSLGFGLDKFRVLCGNDDLSVDFGELQHPAAVQFQLALLALPLYPRPFEGELELDLLPLGEFARLHLGFIDQAPSGDFTPLDFFLILDARLREISLLNEFRLLHFLTCRERRLLALLIAKSAISGEFDALRHTAHLDVMLLRQTRKFALAVDIQRLALGVEILRPDFDLRALLDFISHAPARLDGFRELGQALRIEGVGAVEEFEVGLIEVDDRDALELEAVLGETFERHRLYPMGVVLTLFVHLLERHLRGDGSQGRSEASFQQFARAFGLQRQATQSLGGVADGFAR